MSATIIASVAALGGCADSVETSPTARTGSAAGAAGRCGVLAATRVAEAFVVSANRGDLAAIQALIGPEFVAYTLREGDGAPARFVRHGRRSVVDYLLTRQRQGERVSLLVVEVNERFGRSRAGVSFVVERVAPDLRRRGIRQRLARGKGELLCNPSRIIVWNLAMPRRALNEACGLISCPCPIPRAWNRRTEIVTCADGGDQTRIVPRHERR